MLSLQQAIDLQIRGGGQPRVACREWQAGVGSWNLAHDDGAHAELTIGIKQAKVYWRSKSTFEPVYPHEVVSLSDSLLV